MSGKCPVCGKAVYPMDPHIALDGHKYHKACAKCTDCGCQISLSNFTKCDTVLYCKTHYFKKFHEEGSYVGGDKYENKNPRDMKGGGITVPSNTMITNQITMSGSIGTTSNVATPSAASTATATTIEAGSSSISVSKLTSTLNESKVSAVAETVKPSSIAGRKKVFSMPVG